METDSEISTEMKLPNAAEAYQLLVSDRLVQIKATTANGLFNGVQSFLQLLPPTEARKLEINQVQV